MKKAKLLFIGFIMLQLAVCVFWGSKKRGFFCDEIYSYGLANSENYTFLGYRTARSQNETGWVTSDYFKDYVTVQDDAAFSLKAPFENQKNDVHPPLYYILLHIVCFIFKETFSKWTGLALNFIILIALDFVLFYVFDFVFKDKIKTFFAIFLWTFSAAGLSNILFIRMYVLQTLELFAYIAVHIHILKNVVQIQKENSHLHLKEYALLFFSVIAGGLTHYYFYPFAFFFSLPICLYLLFLDKIKRFFLYASSLLAGFFVNVLIFPATIQHVFSGYRGKEVFKNIGGRENVFFKTYLPWINKSFFGGMLKIFFLLLIFVIVCMLIKKVIDFSVENGKISIHFKKPTLEKQFSFSVNERTVVVALSFIAFAGFSFVAIIGSELKSNRYIYPMYPALAVAVIEFIFFFFKHFHFSQRAAYICIGFCTVFLDVLSINSYGIDWRYKNYDEFAKRAKELNGYDCLLYYPKNKWLDIYTAFPLQFNYDETYFFNEDEIHSLGAALKTRKTENPVVVRIPEYLSSDEKNKILSDIEQNTGFSKHTLKYKYYTEAYLLE